jgi:hypothetical protein
MQRVNMFLGYVRVMFCTRKMSPAPKWMFLNFVLLLSFLGVLSVEVVYKKKLPKDSLYIVPYVMDLDMVRIRIPYSFQR